MLVSTLELNEKIWKFRCGKSATASASHGEHDGNAFIQGILSDFANFTIMDLTQKRKYVICMYWNYSILTSQIKDHDTSPYGEC